jgi:hypothetical protein
MAAAVVHMSIGSYGPEFVLQLSVQCYSVSAFLRHMPEFSYQLVSEQFLIVFSVRAEWV